MRHDIQLAHAREVLAHPEKYFGQPALIADSYAALKEARGQSVDHSRLTSHHAEYVEVAVVARGSSAEVVTFTPSPRRAPSGLARFFLPTGDDAA
ncbi:hypothetical protein [Pseudooceanicola sp.]|uniref:hypothetical protein n=1 Tax=Pseudooceanicola sp. TaxID=1914328 RepID=UPI00405979A2